MSFIFSIIFWYEKVFLTRSLLDSNSNGLLIPPIKNMGKMINNFRIFTVHMAKYRETFRNGKMKSLEKRKKIGNIEYSILFCFISLANFQIICLFNDVSRGLGWQWCENQSSSINMWRLRCHPKTFGSFWSQKEHRKNENGKKMKDFRYFYD